MQEPKVSVIIPVYNVEKYLRECLDSVVNQTLRDIEIICVNDGSTDGSLAILEEYAANDERIRIVGKPNGGLSSARNAGIKIATAKYIAFCDSDDFIEPELCEYTYIAAEYYQCDVLCFEHFAFDFRLSLKYVRSFPPVRYKEIAAFVGSNAKKSESYDKIHVCEKLYRRSFLAENKLFFDEGFLYEDVMFNCLMELYSPQVSIIPVPLYYYRHRQNSIMRVRKRSWSVIEKNTIERDKIMKERLEKQVLGNKAKERYVSGKIYEFFYNGFVLCSSEDSKKFLTHLKENLTADDWNYIHTHKLYSLPMTHFYAALEGKAIAKLLFWLDWNVVMPLREFLSRLGVMVTYHRLVRMFACRWTQRYVNQNKELFTALVKLMKEIVEERNIGKPTSAENPVTN